MLFDPADYLLQIYIAHEMLSVYTLSSKDFLLSIRVLYIKTNCFIIIKPCEARILSLKVMIQYFYSCHAVFTFPKFSSQSEDLKALRLKEVLKNKRVLVSFFSAHVFQVLFSCKYFFQRLKTFPVNETHSVRNSNELIRNYRLFSVKL